MPSSIACTFSQEVQFFGKETKENIISHIRSAGKLIEAARGKVTNTTRREKTNLIGKPYVLLPSSRQTMLLYQFPVSRVTSFLIKAYNLPLTDISRHYISVQKFKDQMSKTHFTFDEKLVTITVTDVFGIGFFQLENLCLPFMIQRLCKGVNLSKLGQLEYKITNSLLTNVFRTITKTGFVIDPYPNNWFVHGYSSENESCNYCIMEYIDLVYENSINTIDIAKKAILSFETI